MIGRDQLPALGEHFDVINAKTTNWCVVPWATVEWARVVHPELDDDAALAKLWEQLVYMLRLDEPTTPPRRGASGSVSCTRWASGSTPPARFAAVRGPGHRPHRRAAADLTVRGDAPGSTTVDGVVFNPNLPTEEVFTTPDPTRTEGVVTATKPLDVDGTVIRGLRVRFEGGRAVQIDADENAEALRARVAKDDGAARLGEVALVDREGRIGKTERSSSTRCSTRTPRAIIALGNAYAITGRRGGSRPDQRRARSTSTS